MEHSSLTGQIIGCAIRVHRELGPGFLESIYEHAMIFELDAVGLPFGHQIEHAVRYQGKVVGRQRYDLLVENTIIVELKAVRKLEDIHFIQVRSYLKALGLKHGLLVNFASAPLTVKRVINE